MNVCHGCPSNAALPGFGAEAKPGRKREADILATAKPHDDALQYDEDVEQEPADDGLIV